MNIILIYLTTFTEKDWFWLFFTFFTNDWRHSPNIDFFQKYIFFSICISILSPAEEPNQKEPNSLLKILSMQTIRQFCSNHVKILWSLYSCWLIILPGSGWRCTLAILIIQRNPKDRGAICFGSFVYIYRPFNIW